VTTHGSTTGSQQTTAARRQLSRVTGVAGLTTMVLVFVPIVAGSGQEPDFDATPAEVVTFFRSVNSPLADLGSFASTVGLIAFLWFVVGLTSLLRVAEGEIPWRSSVAAVSGAVLVALVLAGQWDAATLHADDIDPQVARYAYDEGNASFANGWVALGSFAVCCGWVIAATGFLPRWLGWWAVISGVGLALSRADWTSEIWLLPYGLFWLWVIIVAVLLLRRSAGRDAEHG
jgi:hypothetical protein